MSPERFGRYVLTRRLGRGDLAEVLAGTDEAGRPCVIKRLLGARAEPEVLALFTRECTITCGLPPHPALVRGLGHDVATSPPYLVLAPIAGADLRSRRDAGERAPRSVALGWLAAAAEAYAHLHTHGWVHGDVSPGNLIVDGPRATLCDLGVVQPVGVAGGTRGTHAYMAPEQVRNEAWTAATDVFALGVLAWELASGQRLFHRGPSYLTMAAVVEAPVPPLGEPALDAVLAHALAKDPAARLGSAAELAARLAALAGAA